MRPALLVLALSCGLGCRGDAPPAAPALPPPVVASTATPEVTAPEVVEGHFAWGLETSTFTACGSDDAWWLDAAGAADQALDRVRVAEVERRGSGPVQIGRARVRLRGALSAPGQHGHLGMWARAFTASEVLPPTARPCPAP